MAVLTHCLPHHEIEDDDGIGRTDGTLVRRQRSRPLELGALWAFASSYGAAQLAGQHTGSRFETALMVLTGLMAVVALACSAAAIVIRRRGRTAVAIVIRPRACGAADVQAIRVAREEAGRRAAWVISERGVSREALRVAAALGVRCFASRDDRILELRVTAPTGRVALTPALSHAA
jgi:hypothetical protein